MRTRCTRRGWHLRIDTLFHALRQRCALQLASQIRSTGRFSFDAIYLFSVLCSYGTTFTLGDECRGNTYLLLIEVQTGILEMGVPGRGQHADVSGFWRLEKRTCNLGCTRLPESVIHIHWRSAVLCFSFSKKKRLTCLVDLVDGPIKDAIGECPFSRFNTEYRVPVVPDWKRFRLSTSYLPH